MAPWFEKMEQRLHVAPGAAAECQQRRDPPGCEKLGYHWKVIPAQRPRLLEPRLLRYGLPGQRQAVDAGHHHPGDLDKGGELLYGARQPAAAGRRQGDGPRMPGMG